MESVTELQQELDKFQQNIAKRIPGKILFTKIAGSHSYGLATETSDVDFIVVYQAPLREVLSTSQLTETVDGKDPDFQAHEIGKFCRLLLKGNPNIVECLFTERWTKAKTEWFGLPDMREQFINQTTLKQYLGYAKGQLARWQNGMALHSAGGKESPKWLTHLLRLSFDAQHIAHGEPPQVLQFGSNLEFLQEIRRGVVTAEDVIARFSEIEAEIDGLRPWKIPEGADERLVNDWLFKLRMADWKLKKSGDNLFR